MDGFDVLYIAMIVVLFVLTLAHVVEWRHEHRGDPGATAISVATVGLAVAVSGLVLALGGALP